jgi:hypothetical protein
MHEIEEAGKRTPNKFYDLLLNRYPGHNEDSNKKDSNKSSHGANISRKKQKVWL